MSRRMQSPAGIQAYKNPVLQQYQDRQEDQPKRERGVYESLFVPMGTRLFHVVDSQGELILRYEITERLMNSRVVESLWTILDEVDPAAKLSLVPIAQAPARSRASRRRTPARLELV